MYFSEVSVNGVFESVHCGRCYNLLWVMIPCGNNTLTEVVLSHYENLPMQYTVISKVVKNENFQ